jgi:hypothetical protein
MKISLERASRPLGQSNSKESPGTKSLPTGSPRRIRLGFFTAAGIGFFALGVAFGGSFGSQIGSMALNGG